MKQAQEDARMALEGGFEQAPRGGVLVITKTDREAPIVSMGLDTFLELLDHKGLGFRGWVRLAKQVGHAPGEE
jgi:hypothetical protein